MNYESECREITYATISADSFISVNKKLVWLLGIEASIYLSSLIHKEKYYRKENKLTKFSSLNGEWFFSTQEDLADSTCIPFHKQSQCSSLLKKLHLIEVEKIGIPAKNYFKINYEKIIGLLNKDTLSVIEEIERADLNLNDQSLIPLMTSQKASFSLYKIINKRNKEKASSKEEAKQTEVCNSATINNSSSFINDQTFIKRRTIQQSLPENKPDWSKLHPSTNKRKEIIPLHATEDIEDILSYWNDHYKLPLPKIGTKSYNNCIKLTKAKLKKHTPDKIKEVISNFYIAATDTRYEPAKPDMKFKYQKMTLDRFIYQGFPTPYSLFDKYLDPPKMIGTPVEDLYPNITNKLISLYREGVLGKARTALSTKDINCFRRAAVMLKEFIKNNEDKFSPYMSVDDYKMARYLFECIVKSTNDESKILPHWFCAEHNINKTLPAYMYRQGILEEESRHHSPMSRFNSDGDVTFDLYD